MLAATLGTLAAEPVFIPPQQIISNALAHSYHLQSLGQEIEAAEARKAQAHAHGLPQVTADTKATFYEGLKDSKLGPSFVIPGIAHRYGAGLTITQPAYTGGRLKNQKDGAEHQKQAAQQERRGAEADLVLQAISAYWNWSKAFYATESLIAAVDRMATHARNMDNRYQAGLATDNETLATAVLLDQTRLRLDEARRRVELAGARLTFLTGQALPTNGLPEQAAGATNQVLLPEQVMLAMAWTNRPERAAGILAVKAAEAQVQVSRADFYPQVSLVARYEEARPNLMNIPPSDRWQGDAFAGVGVSWNLFDWGLTKAKVSEAAARRTQARLRLEQVQEQIELEVREARISAQDALGRITVAQRVETSARRNLAAATDLWRNGLARHADVLDAHAQLTDAQYALMAARADLELALAALDHATGVRQPGVRE